MPVDPSAKIASTARIADGAVIGPGVEIGEFCVIEDDVVIGEGCRLEPHVYIKRWTTLGKNNSISAGTVLGTDPLDKTFSGERSYLVIGDDNGFYHQPTSMPVGDSPRRAVVEDYVAGGLHGVGYPVFAPLHPVVTRRKEAAAALAI